MSSNPSRIAELAALVASHTARIDECLAEKGLLQPSFDTNGPAELHLPPQLEQARSIVLQAIQELNDLLQGPRELLLNHHIGSKHNRLVYLKLISRFDIARKIPIDAEVSFADFATDLGIEHGALARILRLGIAYLIFREPPPGVIAHSAASRQIADDALVASWVGTNVDEMWSAAAKVVDALTKWPEAAEANHTNPGRARRFGGAMSFFTTGDGYSLRHLTEGYPWEPINSGTVVDLGGSNGDAAFAQAKRFPGLNLIVQEPPEVVVNSQEEEGLNVKFMTHDFFQPQPVEDADVYFYRWIFHNWPNKYCVKILQALIQ
ncbi:S-adenosyl-L-methionine-dependent methyltransferase [Bimuria novae-zelandiae CBS 107.79]|uniref:S-adenosyl-L-methionine-dependent methyltransferase n=1 Tax=Bimuria novae-zelandiae CBS 107.79 TaxID=1447943 RepID=A0A6A5V1B8_9PLEO|nr:S-adenosyl-L-methionine-dependent methyltransferase [Bimuria novae-zelandiae CBS 107.79]